MPKKRPPARAADPAQPKILKVHRGQSFAGQRSIAVDVQCPGEPTTGVEFVGPSGDIAGPVVMVVRGHQTFVSDPARFGPFGPAWVRRFFEA